MPVNDPFEEESWPRSDIVPSDTKDVQGAKQRGFLGVRLSGFGAIILFIILLSIFCSLLVYFFLI